MPHHSALLEQLNITQWRLRESTAIDDTKHDINEWQDLATRVIACQRCPLGQTRKHAVLGTGDKKATLMIIDDAPSAADDHQGLAFTGPAGELLDKMLAAINLSRDSVYLTHTVKCHPQDDRLPNLTEIAQCQSHLHQQIDWVKPRLILTFGLLAAQSLLHNNSPLEALRNQTHYFGAIPLIASFSPSHLLNNPLDKRGAFQDLLRTQALLQKFT